MYSTGIRTLHTHVSLSQGKKINKTVSISMNILFQSKILCVL